MSRILKFELSHWQRWDLPFGALAVYAIAFATPVAAQEMALPNLADTQIGDAQGEIVVTAQKRVERTRDVPIAITALSGETLTRLGVLESAQLAQQTPALAWGGTTGRSKPSIFLRGVGNDDYRSGSNSPVGTYSDGVYQGNSFGYAQLLLDLSRVEVLRGPQGTLWGKNTTGGLINYVPNLAQVGAPANGYVDLGYGNYEKINVNAAAGIPVTDKLAARIAFGTNKDKGFFRSDNPLTLGPVGGSSWFGIRGSLAYQPMEDLTLVGSVSYSDLDGEARPAKSLGIFSPSVPPFSFTPCTLPNAGRLGTQCGDVFGYVSSPDPYQVAPSSTSIERVKSFGSTLKAELVVGGVTINSLTSYNRSSRDLYTDSDFTPSPLYEYNAQDKFHSFSQELRLSSSGKQRLGWIVGAYLYQDAAQIYQGFNLPVFGNPQTGIVFSNRSQNYAAFADGTYLITPKLKLTLGVRFTRDQRQADGLAFAYNGIVDSFYTRESALSNKVATLADFSAGRQRRDNNLSGRAVLDYHIDHNLLIYASVSRGFKGGDLNSGATDVNAFGITGPEYLTAYQAGLKGALFDDLVTFDIGSYYYDFKDAQVFSEANGATELTNAGKLRMYGIDGNIGLNPTRRLHADLGYAYINSKYVEYVSDTLNTNLAGNTTPYTSKYQLNGNVYYQIPLGEGGQIELQSDASYRTKQFFTAANDPILSQSPYALVNASLSYTTPSKHLTIRAWVKNLTNHVYFTGGYSFSFVGTYFTLPGDPRTYGGSIRYNF